MKQAFAAVVFALALATPALAQEADDPELIFKKTTVWRLLSPDAKLATYAIDDPLIDGVANLGAVQRHPRDAVVLAHHQGLVAVSHRR